MLSAPARPHTDSGDQGIRAIDRGAGRLDGLSLSLGASGNVRTVTMRAFPEPEYREILRGVKIPS